MSNINPKNNISPLKGIVEYIDNKTNEGKKKKKGKFVKKFKDLDGSKEYSKKKK